ncbi:MAG: XdhC family protein [Flavobacteriaceae bacterium]|nr:XdhC family protein [Flavobacteriaceae bacterium]
MTHELKKIPQHYAIAKATGKKTVLATVVALEGSSYRRPGVSMLIVEGGQMIGAVSGGCVEKEILHQAQSVFQDGKAKVMTYDGRYRLGCEGILYILIEPFSPSEIWMQEFQNTLTNRTNLTTKTFYTKDDLKCSEKFGTAYFFSNDAFLTVSPNFDVQSALADAGISIFENELKPCFRLVIVGSEHDAVELCTAASFLGWEVTVIVSPKDPKTIGNFPGANALVHSSPETLDVTHFDSGSAVVLMTHSYVTDLKFLLALKDIHFVYLGLLGPSKRREKLLGEFIEHAPEVEEAFFTNIHGPSGLNLGAETPQEIAVSIVSEILSVIRKQDASPLKKRKGRIHSQAE